MLKLGSYLSGRIIILYVFIYLLYVYYIICIHILYSSQITIENLSPFSCGYRTEDLVLRQHGITLSVIEKWKIMLDKKGYAGVILIQR